jgi:hypothetical protein
MKPRPTPTPILGAAGRRACAWAFLALALAAPAAAQFVPYFGKNKVKYDDFAWRVYRSPHFEVYYYPEFEQHLARLVSYLESGYRKISSELKHEIADPIPVIFYKTHTEFEQTNLYPAFIPEGVAAFTEPVRDRMVIPIDEPPDKLQGLITHELTHVFEFNMIPRTLIQRDVPLWLDEGLADYMRGIWDPLDVMMVRDAAVADQVPRLSRAEFQPLSGRLVYNLGHAAFEFIADRYGKEGIRQFLYTWRKNVVGGRLDEIYQQAFRLKPEEFDEAFERWLKERFKPYRDKQRPSDWGANLTPNSERTPYTQIFGAVPSPSGEMVAAFTANRSDGELDLVLLSAKDGSLIRNLSGGYTGDYESITLNDNFTAGRSLDFAPSGDVIAFVGRTNKRRSLILVSPLTGSLLKKVPTELDQIQAPCLLPGGKVALVAAIKDGVSDIFQIDLETGQTRNLTDDPYADADPRVSPDGTQVVYTRRISGNDKIFTFPLQDPARRTQLTFGAHDDNAPIFAPDGQSIFYASNEPDEIYNLRRLDLKTGVIRQYTDALGAVMAPFPLQGKPGVERVGFIAYHKGEFLLKSLDLPEPLSEPEQDVRAASEESVDFEPDVQHQVIPQNKRRKGTFEKLFLEGRPPLNVGVTSSGDFFGGSQVAMTDVLADQNFVVTALSVREFRSYQGTYINLAQRFQYGLSLFDNKSFFFASDNFSQPGFFREGAIATQRTIGGSLIAQYPLNLYRRLEFGAGFFKLKEEFDNPEVEAFFRAQAAAQGRQFFLNDGQILPLSVGITSETTRFREFGPLTGATWRASFEFAPGLGGNSLGRRTVEGDFRKYMRLGGTLVFATRVRGFKSDGDNPGISYFGGNMELRGYPYLSFSGTEGFHANAELRFPVIDLAATPLGIIGPLRGTLYAGVGAARYKGVPFQFSTREAGVSYVNFDENDPTTFFGEPVGRGFRLVDGRASYGVGLQLFFLGYPLHFDWTKLTDLKVTSKTRFDFWIGFDF